MKNRHIAAAAVTGLLVLVFGLGIRAEPRLPRHLTGLINDYSPVNISPTGPWEIRGQWQMHLMGASGKATFTAQLTMVRSDYWILATPGADPDNPAARMPHTHHLSIPQGTVTPLANGFRVSGPAVVTASGNPAPFGPSSELQVDVTGGSSVPYSNVKVTFTGDAIVHFGTQALEGVVRTWR
jgi:hypothetical protein